MARHRDRDDGRRPFGPAWQSILDQAVGDERQLITELSEEPGIPIPVVGIEIGDGLPVSLAWPDLKIVAAELTAEDTDELAAAGWTIVGLTRDDVLAAHQMKE